MTVDGRPATRREARLAMERGAEGGGRLEALRSRSDRAASVLLVIAAACVVLGGVALALGFADPHTLLVYTAVAFGGLGVVLSLPRVFSSVPFDPERPMPRRREDD